MGTSFDERSDEEEEEEEAAIELNVPKYTGKPNASKNFPIENIPLVKH